MKNDPVKITLTLRKEGVVVPALRSMRRASEIVAFTLNNLAEADLTESPRLNGPDLLRLNFDEDLLMFDRKAEYTDWVLERGFRDLAHGIRGSLEEAFFYIEIVRLSKLNGGMHKGKWGEFQELLAAIRKEASSKHFPHLLAHVNKRLISPLKFKEEYESVNKVRNCFEHASGIVVEKYVNHEKGMRLALPSVRLYYIQSGKEVELAQGDPVEADTDVIVQLRTRERFFPLGSRVTFSDAEFDEIASACIFFADDLGLKLPDIL